MKKALFILSLFISVQVFAQTSGKKYTFQEIGWSIFLPSDFTAFPSADASIQINPGSSDDSSGGKRLMTAMNDANSFVASLSSCEIHGEKNNEKFDAANRNSYKVTTKGLGEDKGYAIYIAITYFTKKAGEELELMLEHSKFSK